MMYKFFRTITIISLKNLARSINYYFCIAKVKNHFTSLDDFN